MTRNQMNKALQAGLIAAKQNYHLFANSCTHVVTKSLNAAYGVPFINLTHQTPRLNHMAQRFNYYEHYSYSK